MAQPLNKEKYYCEFCNQHWRTVYNLYNHACPLRRLDCVITKRNNTRTERYIKTIKL